jgi:hypothetical protein
MGGVGSGGGTGGGGVVELPLPRHYYPLDGDFKDYGEPSETDANLPDASTSGGNWITSGAISKQAYQITTGNWLQLEPLVTSESPFTLSWWFVVEKDQYQALVSKMVNGLGNGGYLVFSENNYVNVRIDDTGFLKFGTPTLHPDASMGQWTHIVLAFHENISGTNDYLAVWINGEVALETTEVITGDAINNTAYVRFGVQEEAGMESGFQDFEGLVDEIRVYNEVLTSAQVKALYDQDKP